MIKVLELNKVARVVEVIRLVEEIRVPYSLMWMVAKICSHCFFATTTHNKAALL